MNHMLSLQCGQIHTHAPTIFAFEKNTQTNTERLRVSDGNARTYIRLHIHLNATYGMVSALPNVSYSNRGSFC